MTPVLVAEEMVQYFIILWSRAGRQEFTLTGDTYPRSEDIMHASGLAWDDIIDYEIHY